MFNMNNVSQHLTCYVAVICMVRMKDNCFIWPFVTKVKHFYLSWLRKPAAGYCTVDFPGSHTLSSFSTEVRAAFWESMFWSLMGVMVYLSLGPSPWPLPRREGTRDAGRIRPDAGRSMAAADLGGWKTGGSTVPPMISTKYSNQTWEKETKPHQGCCHFHRFSLFFPFPRYK